MCKKVGKKRKKLERKLQDNLKTAKKMKKT